MRGSNSVGGGAPTHLKMLALADNGIREKVKGACGHAGMQARQRLHAEASASRGPHRGSRDGVAVRGWGPARK